MEDQLCRIADSFEKIASSLSLITETLENIEMNGLDVNLSLSGHLNLQGPLLLQHEFSEKLLIAVCNQSIGCETYPFTIESK